MAARKAAKSAGKSARKSPTKSAKKAPRKKAPPPAAKRKASAGRKAVKKKAAARPKTPGPEAIARKIIRATQHPGKVATEDLYAENCVSWEPNEADPAIGHEGRRAKDAGWEEFQDSARTVWKPRNVFIKQNTVCIEWDAEIHTRDGRVVRMEEVAVHELKGGKIVSERFYFNPERLAPPAPEPEPVAARPAASAPAPAPTGPPGPKVDPIDL